jgi:2-deoxy-scyllo-inosamine dehydrogenase (SAM-dependent)
LPDNKKELFRSIEIETITTCNLRCESCPNKYHSRPYAELPTEIIKGILRELEDIKYQGVFSPHFYNEPLSDTRLVDILDFARKTLTKAKIILFTNFTLMTTDYYRRLFPLVDKFLITDDELIIRESVKRVSKELDIHELKKIKTRRLLKNGAFSNRAGSVTSGLKNLKKLEKCPFSRYYMTIDAYGDVHLCCNDFFSRAVFGNVKNQNFLDIWFSKDYTQAREAAYNVSHPLCKECMWGELDAG